MDKKHHLIIFIFIVLFSVTNIYSNLGKLRVSVYDIKGNPISGVKIRMINTKIGSMKYEIITNKKGVATKNALKNHFFDIFLEKEGYQDIKTRFKIPVGMLLKKEIIMKTIKELEKDRETNDPHYKAIKLFNEASNLIKSKEYDKASKVLKESLSLDNKIYQAHYYIGVIYFETEKYKEAVEPLKKAIELNEKYGPPYRLLVSVFDKLKNKKESDKYLILAQQKGGKTAIDAFNEGSKYFNEGKTEKAIKAFNEAIKKDPKLVEAYYRLGLTYLNKGLTKESVVMFKKYLEFKPKNKEKIQTATSIIKNYK